MVLPKIPENEKERLAALKSYQILDTISEQSFDDITQIASQICGTPISLISLVDEKRQWFKSRVGLEATETPRDFAFCGHAINDPHKIFEVPNALEDDRFHDNPLVTGAPNVRFYAGAPLVTPDGEALGTLCVIDKNPKVLTDDQKSALEGLARQVMAQLDLRRKNTQLSTMLEKHRKINEEFEVLSLVARKADNIILILDDKKQIIYVNQAFLESCGYTEQEVLSNNPLKLFKNEYSKEIYAKLSENIIKEKPFSMDLPYRKKEGGVLWVDTHISIVYDKKGKTEKYIAVGSDITTLREERKKLANLSLVASKTHSAVIITNATGEIEYANPAFEAMTGYLLEEVKGKKPGSVLQGKDTDPIHIEQMNAGIRSLKPFNQVILNYTKSGEAYWLSCSISPVFDQAGKLMKFVAVEQDITRQKEHENALIKAKEEAIAGELVKDQFLSNMSHEIRTPMNGIIGISNILLKNTDLSNKSRELVQHINGAANHLLVIINDILDLSKINAEKLTFEKINFDFRKIFKTLHYSLGLKAKEKGIEFITSLDPHIPSILAGDPTRFNQILLNLSSNAIKFTERGKVRIEATILEINDKGPKIKFYVKDTGIGIKKDKIKDVFTQFTQSNLTIARKFGGTGLGLSIAKRLVQMHEGSIEVESEYGKGTVFSFSLQFFHQIAQTREVVTTFVDLSKAEKANVRILLAEDNKLNQIVATRQIRNFGFNIEVAENGQEAIDLLLKNDYDLILMDVNMPEMNGLDATRYIRKNLKEKRNIKIAAMTASVLTKDIQLCYDAGMDDFISKPFIPEELYQKIILLLKKNNLEELVV